MPIFIYSANEITILQKSFADENPLFADKPVYSGLAANNNKSNFIILTMPCKLKKLFYYFLIFNFIWGLSAEMNTTGIAGYFKGIFKSTTSIGLEITTTAAFFLYALSAYCFLWYFSKQKRQLLAYLFILAFIPVIILFRYVLEEIFCPAVFGFHNYNTGITMTGYLLDNKYFSIPYTAFGIIFYYVQSNKYKESEKMELQLEKRQAELYYLKSQINPHFLLNNLNNIYSLIYHKSDKSLFAVEQLCSLLQYMLYEKNDLVMLSDELRYLDNFISLQKLRYNFELPLDVSIDTKDENIKIAPFLLIPLVENAFKHSTLNDHTIPLTIHLSANSKRLQFKVENKKADFHKDSTSGIGITNVKRRLDLLYTGRHTFSIEENDTRYKTTLTINLER